MPQPTRPRLSAPGLADLEVRAATLADVEAVYRLVSEAARAVTGGPDTTPEETLAELQDPVLDVASDTTLVVAREEVLRAVAYGLAFDEHEAEVYLDVYLEPTLTDEQFTALGRPLVAWTMERLRERLRTSGRTSVKVGTGSYAQERRQRALLEEAGFVAERVYWRMSVDLDVRPPRPPLPPTMTLRRLDLDDPGDRGIAHWLHEEPFTEHHGYQPQTLERFWERHRPDNPVLDPTMWWVAEVEGEPAGLLVGNETRAAEGGGYVASLGVLARYRGLGVGRQLLHESFDQYAARGRTWVSLGVDSENTTGATRLYESVGMSPSATVLHYSRGLEA